ncbi:MAG TPA: diadenylate cyclase CdaA [Kofleriaceae bacterium]|nr:diadenylate cyclase CdaA [Kofleriaceae bacterium]
MTDFFSEMFRDRSATDILAACADILLVYYLLYRVLLTIKGTRAAQMVIGIVLVGAAFFAAERFQLTTVSWLLDNFIEYFIILIIVVFQHDIRRALTRIGQNVSRFGRTHEIRHALDEVVDASEHLAKARIGGIVVFERDVLLEEFLDHGEKLDARVSRELLVTLFVPSRDNVLHDGAVVIKNLRLERAGAVLPLSRSQMASNFGTRHRAALGITEETDAVSVVISEERGEISLCFQGNIARDLEPDQLRRALRGLFYSSDRESAALAQEAQAAAAIAAAVAALGAEPGAAPVDEQPASATQRLPRASTTRPAEGPLRAASSRPIEEGGG